MNHSDQPDNEVQDIAQREARVWEGSPYYQRAEEWTWLFWNEARPFARLFRKLDPRNLLELACGHGRHSEHVLLNFSDRIETLTLMDVLQSNVDACRERLGESPKLRFVCNSGTGFAPVADGSISAIFCYDAMVHFHRDVVRSYLIDARRVLAPAGMALFHHSNHAVDPDSPFGSNPHARAYMSIPLFREMAEAAGLRVLAQEIIPWGNIPHLDGISLVQKA